MAYQYLDVPSFLMVLFQLFEEGLASSRVLLRIVILGRHDVETGHLDPWTRVAVDQLILR
jgi:hypothetical protein